jgi:hypothetical protein
LQKHKQNTLLVYFLAFESHLDKRLGQKIGQNKAKIFQKSKKFKKTFTSFVCWLVFFALDDPQKPKNKQVKILFLL